MRKQALRPEVEIDEAEATANIIMFYVGVKGQRALQALSNNGLDFILSEMGNHW